MAPARASNARAGTTTSCPAQKSVPGPPRAGGRSGRRLTAPSLRAAAARAPASSGISGLSSRRRQTSSWRTSRSADRTNETAHPPSVTSLAMLTEPPPQASVCYPRGRRCPPDVPHVSLTTTERPACDSGQLRLRTAMPRAFSCGASSAAHRQCAAAADGARRARSRAGRRRPTCLVTSSTSASAFTCRRGSQPRRSVVSPSPPGAQVRPARGCAPPARGRAPVPRATTKEDGFECLRATSRSIPSRGRAGGGSAPPAPTRGAFGLSLPGGRRRGGSWKPATPVEAGERASAPSQDT